jgi:hypothetical protein
VFDHNYHFDHLLDTAYEVEGGHPYHFNGGASPGEAASPLSSQGDLTELGGEPHSGGGGCMEEEGQGLASNQQPGRPCKIET